MPCEDIPAVYISKNLRFEHAPDADKALVRPPTAGRGTFFFIIYGIISIMFILLKRLPHSHDILRRYVGLYIVHCAENKTTARF